MVKRKCACMIMILCMAAFSLAGCGREQEEKISTETEKTTGQNKEADKNEKEEPAQTEVQTEEDSEDTGADTQAGTSAGRTATIYYVDPQTAEIMTKTEEVQDENNIWNILKEDGLLTEDCELLSFKVNEADKKIDLDFNAATGNRIRSMGTTGETEIIGCIVNTYLDTYNCDGIRLTEEGNALQTSSGADFDGYSGRITF